MNVFGLSVKENLASPVARRPGHNLSVKNNVFRIQPHYQLSQFLLPIVNHFGLHILNEVNQISVGIGHADVVLDNYHQ
jgi:hypothetical protein